MPPWTPANVIPRRPRSRRRWVTAGRAHIELRSLPPEELAVFTAEVEARLGQHEAVRWVEVNPFVYRVVVAFDPDAVSVRGLVEIVEEVEFTCNVHLRPFPRDAPEHPGDIEPLVRDGLSLGADLVGIGLGLCSRLVPVPSVVRADLGAFAKLLEEAPPLRRALSHRVGAPIADVALGVFGSVTEGLAFGPFGPMIELTHRTVGLLEHRARGAVWSRREPKLCAEPTGGLVPVAVEPRPVRVPPGPVDTYVDGAWYGTVAAVAGSLALTRSTERAAAAVYAGAPRAAIIGPHAFAAQLSRVLAARGVLPLDPGALRLLDRADCVVVEGDLLLSARHTVVRVQALADVSDPEARRRAGLLLDPDRPHASVERDRWSLAPATGAAHDEARRRQNSSHLAIDPDASCLALAHDGSPVALVETRPALVPGAAELLDAVRRRGMRPLVVIHGADHLGRLGDIERVEPGPAATEAVRALQREGHVVVAVAGRDLDLLAAADCSLGMCGPEHPTPWAADLLAEEDLADAFFVVEAAHAARAVSRQSVMIAGAGAGVGLLLAFGGRVPGSARRASAAVNAAAAASVLNGLRGGLALGRLPVRLDHDPTPWHALAPDAALAQLETSAAGLTEAQAALRRRPVAGPALLPVRFVRSVAGELVNPLTPVLAGGAVLSALSGSFGDAVMVGAVMGVDAMIGGVQRFRTDRAIEQLGQRDGRTITVRRGGTDVTVDAATLVPGDVILVRAGATVPADCRILEGEHLEADESSLTGESMPVRKGTDPVVAPAVAERSSMLYEGTSIAAGDATAVVTAVGSDTEARRGLAFLVAAPESGVEARLHTLLAAAIPVSLLSGAGVVAVGLLRGRPLRSVLGAGVSLAVAAVPEGLPFLATVAQLGAARRLSRRGALVRNPRAIEALGRIDVVCADKTGTLTLGEIHLRLVSDGATEVDLDALRASHRDTLATALRAGPDPNGPARLPHPTDRACVEGARRAGVGEAHGLDSWVRRRELPFEPARGYHATLGDAGPSSVLCLKGAPEVVLPKCTQRSHRGRSQPLDDAARADLRAAVDRMGRRGLRVLAVAQRDATARATLHDRHIRDLTFLGFVALSDPVRPTAAAAVDDLRRAGISVVMITGDHPSTAEGIGAELGLLDHGVMMTGTELDAMSEDELDAMLEKVAVFARVTPTHKVRIVRAFQRAGRAVAMTGDGANDAPAIRLADVGIALGERSTAAARDAADLVVTDERIETIVDAVIEGRAMWSSLRDAIAVLVGGNVGEVAFTIVGTLVTGAPPLNARQLLLVNLLTDAAPAMAIALRRPRDVSPETLLTEGPETSLGDSLTRAILLRGATTAAGAGTAYVLARVTGRRARAATVGLVALTGVQFAQTLALGGRDPYVLAAGIGSALLLAGIVQTPGVSQLFGCTPIGPVGWGIGISCAVGASIGAQLLPRALPGIVASVRPGARAGDLAPNAPEPV